MWGGVQEGTVPLAQLLAGFQSLLPLPTSKFGLSGADSWVGGFVYVLGPCESLQQTLLWGWEFFLLPQPPQVFSVRGFETLFSCNPGLHSLSCSTGVLPSLSAHKCGTAQSSSHCLAQFISCHLTHPGLLAASLLRVLSTPGAHLCPS